MNDATKVPVAVIDVGGQPHMRDAKGALLPVELVKPEHALEDDVVREIAHFARELSEAIARFRAHTMMDLGIFDALLAEKYGVKKGGPKGNRTYQSYDGCLRIKVQVADFIDFGPQLQVAKSLVDECLMEWAADTRSAKNMAFRLIYCQCRVSARRSSIRMPAPITLWTALTSSAISQPYLRRAKPISALAPPAPGSALPTFKSLS